MIQNRFRAPVTALISPMARWLLRIGLTPNVLTVFGALGSSLCALYFFSQGKFFLGTVLVTFFVLSDLLDGTMARQSEAGPTKLGALIDSTLDRVSDAAIFIGILLFAYNESLNLVAYLALIALVTGTLIPYIRAKAESLGIECSVGIAERTERLILVLVGTGFYGLGVNWALSLSLSAICMASAITVVQRMLVVARA
ncbi:MAG: CDP-alcohol phosphatidyltransferase family protein [Candidatus Nanopelagicaceae bacterium]|nr:CDP-alcohol phosphatidyltransferase family protein [Candidatus Nanopelagicaceae bacterium]